MKLCKLSPLVAVLALSFTTVGSALVSVAASAQEAGSQQANSSPSKASDRPTRRVPTLRAKVYEQLARAQALADEAGELSKSNVTSADPSTAQLAAQKLSEAIAVLDEVESKASSMNSYELAMLYNFYGFIYYNDEQYDKAIQNFEKVVEQQPIPESFELSTLFSLAQLHLMQGNYADSIRFLERWEALTPGKIPPKNKVLKAQAYYQNKQYEESASFITQAIEEHEAEGMIPDEGWLILQRAVYYELKNPAMVKDILVKMVQLFDDPKYWIQLAGMYGELGEEKKQLAMMETAYQRGFIVTAGDIFNLAQLYYYHRAPYKGAKLMEQAMQEGVLEKNLRNLRFLGQSWSLAKENDKAIPAMQAAAALADDGELDAQLAQILLNQEDWDQALQSANSALQKGGLRNQGLVHLIKGMALYNKKQYAMALDELAEAEKHGKSRAMAQQWMKFVQSEKSSAEQLSAELGS